MAGDKSYLDPKVVWMADPGWIPYVELSDYKKLRSRLTHIEQTLDQLFKDKLINQHVYNKLMQK